MATHTHFGAPAGTVRSHMRIRLSCVKQRVPLLELMTRVMDPFVSTLAGTLHGWHETRPVRTSSAYVKARLVRYMVGKSPCIACVAHERVEYGPNLRDADAVLIQRYRFWRAESASSTLTSPGGPTSDI